MTIFGTVFFEDLQKYISPIIYIIVGVLIYNILKSLIRKALTKKTLKKRHHQKRAETVSSLIINVFKYLIAIVVILAILSNFGFNIATLVAGLGIGAAIIGLALQDFAKDLLAGLTIIIEDQYEIGDTVDINGFMGEVIFIGLRSTRVRDYKGATLIIGNHTVTSVINYNLHNSLALVEVPVSRKENPEKVEKVLNEMAEKLSGTIPKAKGNIEVWGIDKMSDQAVVFKVALEVASMEQYGIQRMLLKEIRDTFEKNKIKVPYQKLEVKDGK